MGSTGRDKKHVTGRRKDREGKMQCMLDRRKRKEEGGCTTAEGGDGGERRNQFARYKIKRNIASEGEGWREEGRKGRM